MKRFFTLSILVILSVTILVILLFVWFIKYYLTYLILLFSIISFILLTCSSILSIRNRIRRKRTEKRMRLREELINDLKIREDLVSKEEDEETI